MTTGTAGLQDTTNHLSTRLSTSHPNAKLNAHLQPLIPLMKSALPLVRLPPNAVSHRFGTPPTAPRSTALLRFPSSGWTIDTPNSSKQGWAIVGDAEGRRLAVEVGHLPNSLTTDAPRSTPAPSHSPSTGLLSSRCNSPLFQFPTHKASCIRSATTLGRVYRFHRPLWSPPRGRQIDIPPNPQRATSPTLSRRNRPSRQNDADRPPARPTSRLPIIWPNPSR